MMKIVWVFRGNMSIIDKRIYNFGDVYMKEIKVLGPGCPNCVRMTELVQNVANDLGIEHRLEKVTDMNDIMSYGVMATPALIVNGETKISGKVPSEDEVKEALQ